MHQIWVRWSLKFEFRLHSPAYNLNPGFYNCSTSATQQSPCGSKPFTHKPIRTFTEQTTGT